MIRQGRFGTDLIFYLLGALIPGINNFLIILVLKLFLKPFDFGYYSLRFGLVLLLSITGVGWITQSIVRFLAMQKNNKLHLLKTCVILGFSLLLLLAIVLIFSFYFFIGDSIFHCLLMGLALISSGLQLIFISYTQANFNSRIYFRGEIIRTLSYLILSFFIAKYIKAAPISFLWMGYIISNLFGISFLVVKNRISIKAFVSTDISSSFKRDLMLLLRYGSPLAIWFILLNCMNYIEKPLLIYYTGDYERVGDYQAMFDIILRGTNIFLLPMSYAIFPHITRAYEEEDLIRVKNLMKRVLGMELIALSVALFLFGILGFDILVRFFKIPDIREYYFAGFVMLTSATIWQMAVIVHKPLELNKSTMQMVLSLFYSFIIYIILLFWLPKLFNYHLAFFTMPALLAGIFYIIIVYIQAKRRENWVAI